MDKKYVFISYSSAEYSEAKLVRDVLTENGIQCWMAPDSIPIGSSYAMEIGIAIENCEMFLLILSQKSQESAWVEKELDSAINGHKIVYPFMIENCKLNTTFNFYLNNVQRHAAFESKSVAMEKMVRDIKALFGMSAEDSKIYEKSTEVTETADRIETHEAPKKEEPEKPVTNNEITQQAPKKSVKAKIVSFLKKLTPYSRKGAKDEKVKFALNVSTVFCIVFTLMFAPFIFESYYYYYESFFRTASHALLTVASFLLIWNIMYPVSLLVAKIKTKNKTVYKILAFVLCAILAFAVKFVVMFAEYSVAEWISDSIYYSYYYYY